MARGGRITEALMREALLGAGTAVWEWDVRNDCLSSTDDSAALLGYAPGEIADTQIAWNALIHPDDLQANHEAYLHHARGGGADLRARVPRARCKDGSWRWLAERGRVIERDAHGEPLRAVGTLSDITQRREAQGAALELAARLGKLARHVPGLLYQYRSVANDPLRGNFPFISDSVIDLLGLPPAELMRDATAVFRLIHRDDLERVRLGVVEAARTLRPWRCEFRLFDRDAQPRWVNVLATPQREPEGTLLWHGYIQDVTDLRELQQARAEAAAAQAANRAKTEFLSRMSHELRTPLNAVLGFAQLLEIDEHEPLSEQQRRRVVLIREAGAHLLEMIGELLDLTRIESGQMAVEVAPLALEPLIADCVELVRPQADAGGVSLHGAAGPATVRVLADATRLRQVLLNLLGNAIKYNRRGGRVEVAVAASGSELRIDVSDTGVGIAAEHMASLFQPFQRGAQARGPIEGVGIGTAVTRALVELMGGTVTARSVPGAGSTFSVTLRRAD
ncbi:PAS domain S-box protein [Piscinibacter aquaticus]|uniref:histidine kinase n=1 Tax=Piscinibacter aquaticus TaxID=392597 RepID=A0A5C6U6C8_9BURK|nr:PAS domain S-box protein [Piscinibacter aquaticus]